MKDRKGFTRNQWKEMGFFDGTSEEFEEKATKAMNVAFFFMKDKHEEGKSEQFELLPLMVISRVIRSVEMTDKEALEICKEVETATKTYDFNQFNGYSSIDVEAEFVAEFVDKKLEELKKEK